MIGAGAVDRGGRGRSIGSVLLPGARVAARATVDGSIVGPGRHAWASGCVIRGLSVIGGRRRVHRFGHRCLDGQRVAAGV